MAKRKQLDKASATRMEITLCALTFLRMHLELKTGVESDTLQVLDQMIEAIRKALDPQD